MAYRFILIACLQALWLQNAYTQALPCRPNCGCQQQVTLTETCVQNPLLVNPGCQTLVAQPACPCPCQASVVAQPSYFAAVPSVVANPCCEIDYIGQYGIPSTTIIQDDSIANNLANTLQLLIVSNLLGNTLPFNDIVNLGVPAIAQPALLAQPALQLGAPAYKIGGCGCGCGCGGGCGCGCGGCGCGCGCNPLFVL